MTVNLSKLIIIDVEATCWPKGEKPENESSEIIEIGICLFDILNWRPMIKGQLVIQPVFSTISKYCTELTGWTTFAIHERGILFSDACNTLALVYDTKKYPWASWGDYDRTAFENDCRKKVVRYPFSGSHFNLKNIFAVHNKLSKGVGMRRALELLEIPIEGNLHSGADDAWNIGRILEAQGRW